MCPHPHTGIVKYMLRHAGPSSEPLNSESELNEFVPSESETRAVAFLSNSGALDGFIEAGNHLRMTMELGHCSDAEAARSMGFEMGTVVVFHARFVCVCVHAATYLTSFYERKLLVFLN